MCFTGTGTTVAITPFTGSITLGRIVNIGEFTEEVNDIEDNDISTTGHTQYCPGGLIEHNELTFDVVWEGAAPPDIGSTSHGDITVTWPVPLGMTTSPTLTGSGYLKRRSVGATENNERIVGTYAWRFDGKTGTIHGETHTAPTWTAAT